MLLKEDSGLWSQYFINPLKPEILLNSIYKNPVRTPQETLRHHYKAEPVNAVWATIRNTLGLGVLRRVVHIVTTGIKGIIEDRRVPCFALMCLRSLVPL